jgi:hypothetical protein
MYIVTLQGKERTSTNQLIKISAWLNHLSGPYSAMWRLWWETSEPHTHILHVDFAREDDATAFKLKFC